MPLCLLELPEQDTIDWWLQQQKFTIYRLAVQTKFQPIRVLARTLFLACRQSPSRCVLTWPLFSVDVLTEREQASSSGSLLLRTLTPSDHDPILTAFTLITYLEAPSADIATLGARASTYEFGGGEYIQS